MNELNVERLNAFGLQAAVERTRKGDPLITLRLHTGETIAHGLPETHRTETFVDPQKPARERMFVETDPSSRAAATALLAVGHAAERVQQLEKDERLSAGGRREATSEATAHALTHVATSYAQVSAEGARLAAQRTTLYAVPEPDVLAAVLDGEIRRDFASRSIDERAQLLRELAEPAYRPLALALSRSPLPLPQADAAKVRQAWEAHVSRAEPAKTAALGKAIAANQAVSGLLKGLSAALTRTKEGGLLERITVYKALKPIEGAWPIEFAAGERGFLEHQIAEAAREAEKA